MLEGIDVNQRIEFISKFDKSDTKTVFVLKPLAGIDGLTGKEHDNPVVNSLLKSIVEVKNFKDKTDKLEIINVLSLDVLNELVTEVNRINSIDDDSKKK